MWAYEPERTMDRWVMGRWVKWVIFFGLVQWVRVKAFDS